MNLKDELVAEKIAGSIAIVFEEEKCTRIKNNILIESEARRDLYEEMQSLTYNEITKYEEMESTLMQKISIDDENCIQNFNNIFTINSKLREMIENLDCILRINAALHEESVAELYALSNYLSASTKNLLDIKDRVKVIQEQIDSTS